MSPIDFVHLITRNKKAKTIVNRGRLEIPAQFEFKYINLDLKKRQFYFDRYLSTMFMHLVESLIWYKDGHIDISTKILFDKCSSFKYKKDLNEKKSETQHVYNELKDLVPFFNIVETGNSIAGKNSKAIINVNMFKLLLDYHINDQDIIRAVYGNCHIKPKKADWVPVDIESLQNFITNNELALRDKTNLTIKEENSIKRDLFHAWLIKRIAKYYDGKFPQITKPSIFGRNYYSGLSIHNISKRTRYALLGKHYQYDLNAAVYASKVAMVAEIMHGQDAPNSNFKAEDRLPLTTFYVNNKNEVRSTLVKECFSGSINKEHISQIKQAITAIGFGARMDVGKSGFLFAINKIIPNESNRNAFLTNMFIIDFVKEQDTFMDEIQFEMKRTHQLNKVKDKIRSDGKHKIIRKSHILAFMYQHYETKIMDHIETIVSKETQVTSRVHDAFSTKEGLSPKCMDEIQKALDSYHPLLTFDVDVIEKCSVNVINENSHNLFDESIYDNFNNLVNKLDDVESKLKH